MEAKLHVLRSPQSEWVLQPEAGQMSAPFPSKAEAVAAARKHAGIRNVIVHTMSGQILRPSSGKTSTSKALMRKAVFDVVTSKAKKK